MWRKSSTSHLFQPHANQTMTRYTRPAVSFFLKFPLSKAVNFSLTFYPAEIASFSSTNFPTLCGSCSCIQKELLIPLLAHALCSSIILTQLIQSFSTISSWCSCVEKIVCMEGKQYFKPIHTSHQSDHDEVCFSSHFSFCSNFSFRKPFCFSLTSLSN